MRAKKASTATKTDARNHLEKVPLFAACSNKDLAGIARVADEIEIEAGRVLVREGDIGHEMFVLIDGEAAVSRNGHKVATLGPGTFFGEMALLDRGPRSATVEAVTPLRVLVIGQREFGGLIDSVPGLATKLLSAMAARLRDADSRAFSH